MTLVLPFENLATEKVNKYRLCMPFSSRALPQIVSKHYAHVPGLRRYGAAPFKKRKKYSIQPA